MIKSYTNNTNIYVTRVFKLPIMTFCLNMFLSIKKSYNLVSKNINVYNYHKSVPINEKNKMMINLPVIIVFPS